MLGEQSMVDPQLLEILACPQCKGDVELSPSPGLVCHACQLEYPIQEGIPIMLIDEAIPLTPSAV